MKLIIDIPADVYTIIKNEPYMSRVMNFGSTLTDAIYDGTPLPKGHGDLIDRNQILQGEHFVVLGDVKAGGKNFGEREIDMFPKQTIMSVKPIIEADKGE